MRSLVERLEEYTRLHPAEVLLVTAEVDDEPDQIMIYRGFSSSLMRPTAADPEVPVLPDTAEVTSIDRLQGPYQPHNPTYIESDLTQQDMEARLQQAGL
ncbi:MAG: DUF7734 family protein [Thainema sp.]